MGDHFLELRLRQAVIPGSREVVVELFGAAIGDQRGDGDEAAVPLEQLRSLPYVAEQNVIGKGDELRRKVADRSLGWVRASESGISSPFGCR